MGRVQEGEIDESLNILLLGDLNLDFDKPENDRGRILEKVDQLNEQGGKVVNVYFPFLHPHPKRETQQFMGSDGQPLRTNARLSETFDQIAIFLRDPRLKKLRNEDAGLSPRGPDFGVFDFVNLFSEALHGKRFDKLSKSVRQSFVKRFEHTVSDHMPLWFRIPLPDVQSGTSVAAP